MDTLFRAQDSPIQELWRESYLALDEIGVAAAVSSDDPMRDITNSIIITGLVLMLIFAHRRILSGFLNIFKALTSTKKLLGIENQSNLQVCRNTLFQFLSLCISFMFANIGYATKFIGYNNPLPLKFAGILGFIILYFFTRRIIFNFLAWVNNKSAIKLVHKISYTYACLWFICILCCFIVIKSIPYAPMAYMRYCVIFSLLIITPLYFSSIFKIFISKGFSLFFYILYLCTLEILPIAMLLYLNFN